MTKTDILNTLKVIILATLVTFGANYLYAAWSSPSTGPTGGNPEPPVNVSGVSQTKNGPFWADMIGSHGGGFFNGNVGIKDQTPDGSLSLDVNGQVGATEFCDENGGNCISASAISGGGDGYLPNDPASSNVDMNNNKITNLSSPSPGSDDAATASYAENYADSMNVDWSRLTNVPGGFADGVDDTGSYSGPNITSQQTCSVSSGDPQETCSLGGSDQYDICYLTGFKQSDEGDLDSVRCYVDVSSVCTAWQTIPGFGNVCTSWGPGDWQITVGAHDHDQDPITCTAQCVTF